MPHFEVPNVEKITIDRDGIVNTSMCGIAERISGTALNDGFGNHSVNKGVAWVRKQVLKHLAKMQRGQLIVQESDQRLLFGDSKLKEADAIIVVNNPAVYTSIAINGVLGAAEAYMEGFWRSPDLVKVVRFMVSNMGTLQGMNKKRSWANKLALALLDKSNRNSLSGSRKNISAHYDLGNDFFELILDPTMMYSSALFNRHQTPVDSDFNQQTLEQASLAKLEAICQQLELKEGDHLLEIGTGWGSMAIYAAEHYGCTVTTTTISQRQFDYASQCVQEKCLQSKITVLLKDYRQLTGRFDKLVSIEMIEAVGHQYFKHYFSQCSSLLKSNGLMLIQAITIPEQRYEKAKRSVDFIKRYIFPGGCLPSLGIISHHVGKDTDMNMVAVSDMTLDYAETLKRWFDSFCLNREKIFAMGFDQRFIRMWEYYLCYCEGGFRERVIGTHQLLLAKPDYRPCIQSIKKSNGN